MPVAEFFNTICPKAAVPLTTRCSRSSDHRGQRNLSGSSLSALGGSRRKTGHSASEPDIANSFLTVLARKPLLAHRERPVEKQQWYGSGLSRG